MGSMQTNIVEGTRAYSNLEWIYLKEGKQMPMIQTRTGTWNVDAAPPRTINKKQIPLNEYLVTDEWNAYNKKWEDTVDYAEVYDYNLNQNPNTSKIAKKFNTPKHFKIADKRTYYHCKLAKEPKY